RTQGRPAAACPSCNRGDHRIEAGHRRRFFQVEAFKNRDRRAMDDCDTKIAELRRRAMETLKSETSSTEKMPVEDVRKLVEELHVHQVELEMQNEELRSVQRELEQSRKKFSDLYDFAPVGYLTTSEDGRIIEANLTAAKQLGIERSLLVG